MANYDEYDEKIRKLFSSPTSTSENDNNKESGNNHSSANSVDNFFSRLKYKENKTINKIALDKS